MYICMYTYTYTFIYVFMYIYIYPTLLVCGFSLPVCGFVRTFCVVG